MELSSLLSISYYKVVAPIDEPHKVYLVQHQDTGRFFVKKTLDIYSAEVYRDLQENPIPGIPRIIEFAEDEDRLIVIEEFISGITLYDKVNETVELSRPQDQSGQSQNTDSPDHRPGSRDILTVEKIGQYMISLCEILERLHSHNPPLIHRDLKPSNIMITPFDDVALLDFNAARFYSGGGSKSSDTVLMGTQGYAAPEQYGFKESSPQTDLFSVGKILEKCVSSLPEEDHTFDKIIKKCTQMDPARRYASAGALRAAIMRSLGQSDRPDITGPTVNPYLPPGFRTLNPWKMLIASAVYFLLFSLSLTLNIHNMDGTALQVVRVGVLLIGLVDILIGTNYMNIQQLFPFLRKAPGSGKTNSGLRAAGVILAMVIATFVLFALMVFVVQILFGGDQQLWSQ